MNQNFVQIQFDRNAKSRLSWIDFEGHRKAVTAHITKGNMPSAQQSLCVLGAGNCNDIDLGVLIERFEVVHLVDLDVESIVRGVKAQNLATEDRIVVHALNIMDDASIGELRGPFDVVASTCILSQLVEGAVAVVDEGNPKFSETIEAVRHQHLRIMIDLMKDGGIGVLVTDFVSSDSFPKLVTMEEKDLPAAAIHEIDAKNFLHGTNPFRIQQDLLRNFSHEITRVQLVNPWRWKLGSRHYLVSALKFQKK